MAFRQLEETLRTLLAKVGVLEKRTTPSGAILQYAASTAPTGWLLCDGTAVSRVDYADLFAVIGTTYGTGNGSTTFNLPNMKGRVPAGRDASQTEFDTLGEAGGHKGIPYHSHYLGAGYDGVGVGNAHAFAWGSGKGNVHILNAQAAGGAGSDNRLYTYQNIWNQTAPGGDPASTNNLPPYLVLNHIIKV